MLIKFEELTVGDRFNALNTIWTKLSATTARKHSTTSIELGSKGYGYIGDSICSFELEERVEFLPVVV